MVRIGRGLHGGAAELEKDIALDHLTARAIVPGH